MFMLAMVLSAVYLIIGVLLLSSPILHYKKFIKEGKTDLIVGSLIGGVCITLLSVVIIFTAIVARW